MGVEAPIKAKRKSIEVGFLSGITRANPENGSSLL